MKLIVASLALAGLSSAYVLPGAAPTGAVVRSSSDVVMIGRKNSTPKKAAAKKAEEEKPWGFFDFLQAGRKGGNLELLNPTVYKQLTPEEYDTRSFKANVKPKSGTINKNDASTW